MTRRNISSGGPFEDVFGYSRAVKIGNQVHVAGTCAQGDAIKGDTYAQAKDALRIIEAALAEAGATLNDVVRTRIYVTDIQDKDMIARAHGEAFRDIKPAATLVEVSKLITPELTVEIEAYAVVEG